MFFDLIYLLINFNFIIKIFQFKHKNLMFLDLIYLMIKFYIGV